MNELEILKNENKYLKAEVQRLESENKTLNSINARLKQRLQAETNQVEGLKNEIKKWSVKK